MKKLLFSLFAMSALCLGFVSCTEEIEEPGSIYGVVTDKATGEPIRSAGVELSPTGAKTVTGSEGQFEFTQLKAGQYTLLITKTGYTDYASSTIEVTAGATAKTDVQIEQLPPALKVVNDSREEISELDFGSAEDDVARSFNIFNDGVETLEWELTKTTDWIKEISKTSGTLKAGAAQAIIITIDRTLLKSGENQTTVHITSNNGSKQLTVIATNSTVLATLNTLPVSDIKTSSAILHGKILTKGTPTYSERGFVYATQAMPTVETTIAKSTVPVTNEDEFSITVTNLQENTTYFVRAYAINGGFVSYSSNEVQFIPTQSLARVATHPVSNVVVLDGIATFNGEILDVGDPTYIERGFVYGIQRNPTVEDDMKQIVAGRGEGMFSANVNGLKVGNTYYVRAYVTNEVGTAYGEEIEIVMEDATYLAIPTIEYGGSVYKYVELGQLDNSSAWSTINNLNIGGHRDWTMPSEALMVAILNNTSLGDDHNQYWWINFNSSYFCKTHSQYRNYYVKYMSGEWQRVIYNTLYCGYSGTKCVNHQSFNVCAVRKH